MRQVNQLISKFEKEKKVIPPRRLRHIERTMQLDVAKAQMTQEIREKVCTPRDISTPAHSARNLRVPNRPSTRGANTTNLSARTL